MGRADQKKLKSFFGGKSLSDFRKSVGLDKDKSKASTTKQERDKNIKKGYRADDIKKLNQVDTTGGDTVLSLSRGDPISNFKAPETPSTFVKDLKDAYKSGLFTGGNKTKEFMDKYNLEPKDIVKLRTGIDQGIGTRIGSYGNVLEDIMNDLYNRDILTYKGASGQAIYDKAQDIYEPGMTKYDRDPLTGILGMAPLANLGIKGMDLIAGGSEKGLKGLYFGREKGLTGDELENFAAAVANDDNLYNQMMTTPEMQNYQVEKFRTDTIKQAMDKRRSGDPDPISGTQPGEEADEDESNTDPGTDPVYTPPPQNYFTFFDPNLGRYRSGTYDEYLQYVTAKDGGIIQLENGGDPDEEQFVRDNKIVNLRNILSFIRDNKEMPVNTEGQKKVQAETDKLLGDMLKDRFTDMEGITGLTVKSGDAVKMAEEDQPIRDLLGRTKESLDGILQNIKERPDLAGEPETTASMIVLDNRDGKLKVVPRNRETLEMLRNGTYSQTNRDAIESGVMVSPSPISDRRLVNPDTNDQIDDMMRDQFMNRLYDQALEFQNQKEQDGGTTVRDPKTNEVMGYNVADGGIIGLKEGGMNDMMQADSLMFKDPSDEGQWEYNV